MTPSTQRIVTTTCPAKLNLFLELLARRDDGFHEIDTLMVAIDLCDDLAVRTTARAGIRIDVDLLPSRQDWIERLGLHDDAVGMLTIPTDERNLIHRATRAMADHFDLPGGFDVRLRKRIPAGAGMGGASSNAAMTLIAITELFDLPIRSPAIRKIAADLGSDVPFFLGAGDENAASEPSPLVHAGGRGEKLRTLRLARTLHFVIVFPAVSLSTADVYRASTVPQKPASSQTLADQLATCTVSDLGQFMLNRLSDPAKKIAPQIDEIHETMWQSGLKAVQLTGSGSASFAIAGSEDEARSAADRLRTRLTPGALVMTARSLPVPVATQKRQL